MGGSMKRLCLMAGILLLATGLAAPALSAAQANSKQAWGHSGPVRLRMASAPPSASASEAGSPAAGLFRKQGYLVPSQAAYERAKAAAAARAGIPSTGAAPKPAVPKVTPSKVRPLIASGDPDIFPAWTGQTDPSVSPPDTTGAVGPSRYITAINDRFGIYDRSGNVVSSGGLRGLAGANTDCVTDPQIMWDPQTNRFYYVVLEFSHFVGVDCGSPPGPPNDANQLFIGFSRGPSPSTGGDSSWCKYVLPYFPDDGDLLPDYPKLGDNSAFWMIGSNVFDNDTGDFLGGDLAWITKPRSGRSCPNLSANHVPGGPLLLHDGSTSFTPVPANQIDASSTGYLLATPDTSNGDPASFIDSFPISTNFNDPIGAPVAHTVAAFTSPPPAPQAGTAALLDTLDARLTNAVSAYDPSKQKTAVWTQHTVAGTPGSEVRWYEIQPAVDPVFRSGTISDASLFVYNAAISPDRKVSGSIKRFGDAFVVGFNTSSATDFVRIQMVSQWADNPMSEFVEVKASPGFNEDFSCLPVCRWGDYSGASPDPAASRYSNHGRVWLANQWNVASVTSDDADWRTYIWGTNPVPYAVLTAPTSMFKTSASFKVGWSLGNQASLADVRYRRAAWNGNFSDYIPWKSMVPAGTATFTGRAGKTYCFSAQSYDDTDSGPRPWGFGGERCAVVPLDDRSLSASSGWSRLTGTGFFNGTFTRSTTLGKFLNRTGIHAKSIRVLVEKCPGCGSIKIYWNGSLQHTYSLNAGSVHKKVYLSAVSFSSIHVGTLKIVVSSSGKPVIIDGLGVSHV